MTDAAPIALSSVIGAFGWGADAQDAVWVAESGGIR